MYVFFLMGVGGQVEGGERKREVHGFVRYQWIVRMCLPTYVGVVHVAHKPTTDLLGVTYHVGMNYLVFV